MRIFIGGHQLASRHGLVPVGVETMGFLKNKHVELPGWEYPRTTRLADSITGLFPEGHYKFCLLDIEGAPLEALNAGDTGMADTFGDLRQVVRAHRMIPVHWLYGVQTRKPQGADIEQAARELQYICNNHDGASEAWFSLYFRRDMAETWAEYVAAHFEAYLLSGVAARVGVIYNPTNRNERPVSAFTVDEMQDMIRTMAYEASRARVPVESWMIWLPNTPTDWPEPNDTYGVAEQQAKLIDATAGVVRSYSW